MVISFIGVFLFNSWLSGQTVCTIGSSNCSFFVNTFQQNYQKYFFIFIVPGVVAGVILGWLYGKIKNRRKLQAISQKP